MDVYGGRMKVEKIIGRETIDYPIGWGTMPVDVYLTNKGSEIPVSEAKVARSNGDEYALIPKGNAGFQGDDAEGPW